MGIQPLFACELLSDGTLGKRCSKCGKMKPVSEYPKDIRLKSGLRSFCKKCERIVVAISKKNHIERERAYWKKYRSEHREQIRMAQLLRYRANPERARERAIKWRRDNLDRAREIDRNNTRKRLLTAKGVLNNRMAREIWSCLHGRKAGRRWEGLVGYTADQLKRQLEKHFLPGMTWENTDQWHIDHIIPKSAFNFETPEDIDFKRCWALKNLRPLWKLDNLSKFNHIERPFQPSLAIGG